MIYEGEEGIFERYYQWNEFWIIYCRFFEALFFYMKYIFVFVLFAIGLLTLKRFRGFYRGTKVEEFDMDEEQKIEIGKMKEMNLLLGIFYFFLATGILLGYLVVVLMILLDPFPDQFLFDFIEIMISNEDTEGFKNFEKTDTPFKRGIYYSLALISFLGFAMMIMGLRFMILYANKSHVTSFRMLLVGLVTCILTGFTTFMPLFL